MMPKTMATPPRSVGDFSLNPAETRDEARPASGDGLSVRVDMMHDSFKPQRTVFVAAVAAVAATYVYFLIFAQFGFLKAVQEAGAAAPPLKALMTVMGLAGLAGGAAAARWHSVAKSPQWLMNGFLVSAVAAGVALLPGSTVGFYGVAVLTGAGLGATTVTLASMLRRALGGAHLGTAIGLGTGLAYAFCNLPPIFAASASRQAMIAVGATLGGWLAARALVLRANPDKPSGYDYSPQGMVVWVLVFFGLVGLDSAAFYVIQHTPRLSQTGWSESGGLFVNAGVHLMAALLTGYALDRRWVGRSIFFGAVALLGACVLLDEGSRAFAQGTILYTAGVSVYSTVLVFYPARGLRPWLTAAVYGVGGWIGSGVGIGLAENLSDLPVAVLAGAAVFIFGLLAWRANGHAKQLRAFHP